MYYIVNHCELVHQKFDNEDPKLNISSYFTNYLKLCICTFVPRLMIEKKSWQKKRRRIVHFVVSLTILFFLNIQSLPGGLKNESMYILLFTCFVRLVIQGLIYSYSYLLRKLRK